MHSGEAELPQDVMGEAMQTQLPALHVPRPQTCPHLPQLAELESTSVHVSPHLVWPVGHRHSPA